MDKYLVALFFLFSTVIGHAATAPLYTLSLNGNVLTVTPTANHYYPAAGILIESGNGVSGCTPNSNGYCLFDMGPSNPKSLTISGDTTNLSGIICLNGKCPSSCQRFNLGSDNGDNPDVSRCTGFNPICRVFVSSTTQNGNLGGVAGGNALCQTLATNAGFNGQWAAWLSVVGGVAPINIGYNANITYVRAAETSVTIAVPGQLTSGTLSNSILRNEMGAIMAGEVWTGTLSNGTNTLSTCDSWTTVDDQGTFGLSNSTTMTWTGTGLSNDGCEMLKSLYCFEVPM